MSNIFPSLLLLPGGLILGILVERLAASNAAPFIMHPRLWNTSVKLLAVWIVWRYVILLPWDDSSRSDGTLCVLPTMTALLNMWGFNITEAKSCESCTEAVKMMLFLIFRCFLFCLSARFGSALQPVGITGGIACGKSTVSSMLRKVSYFGDDERSRKEKKDAFSVIDLDEIAHDILVPGKMGIDCGYNRVVEAFTGEDILEKSTSSKNANDCRPPINRRKLGDVIFRDATKRRKLNGITHPLISRIMMKQIVLESYRPSSDESSIVSVDIPLLFEVGLKMKMIFGIKVMVACTPDVQLDRLMKRNPDLTREQCLKRIESQMPIEQKVKMSDIVIWNNGTMDDLKAEVEKTREEVISRVHGVVGISLAKAIGLFCIILSACSAFDITSIPS